MEKAAFRVGLVQMCAREEVARNLEVAREGIGRAVDAGAELVVLPENFAFIGPPKQKVQLGEELGKGPITGGMAELAARAGIHLVLGGVPERSGTAGKVYNTLVLYGPDGRQLASYRKIHLFDIQVPEAIDILESDTVAAGDRPVVVETELGTLGLSICYDLRFPELYRKLALAGAELLLVPAAFTLFTGKDHWHVLLRARAIENVCYVAAAGQGGAHSAKRASYGRSVLIDPWGRVLAEAPDGELEVVVAAVDRARLRQVRSRMPTLEHVQAGLVGPLPVESSGG